MTDEEKQKVENFRIENKRETEMAIKDAVKDFHPEFAILIMGKMNYILDDKKYQFLMKSVEHLHKDIYDRFLKALTFVLMRVKGFQAKEGKRIIGPDGKDKRIIEP